MDFKKAFERLLEEIRGKATRYYKDGQKNRVKQLRAKELYLNPAGLK